MRIGGLRNAKIAQLPGSGRPLRVPWRNARASTQPLTGGEIVPRGLVGLSIGQSSNVPEGIDDSSPAL
jgi:hypothetical protein